jgi:hypothetical protein
VVSQLLFEEDEEGMEETEAAQPASAARRSNAAGLVSAMDATAAGFLARVDTQAQEFDAFMDEQLRLVEETLRGSLSALPSTVATPKPAGAS